MPEQPEQKINRPGQQANPSTPGGPVGTARLDTLVGQLLAAQVAQRGVTMSDSTIAAAIKLSKRILAQVDGD